VARADVGERIGQHGRVALADRGRRQVEVAVVEDRRDVVDPGDGGRLGRAAVVVGQRHLHRDGVRRRAGGLVVEVAGGGGKRGGAGGQAGGRVGRAVARGDDDGGRVEHALVG